MSSPGRVLLVGAGGRMGRAILAAADNFPSLTIRARATREDTLESLIPDCEVVIDFSLPEATDTVCEVCAASGCPLVLGTTGHSVAQKDIIRQTAEKIPLVFAANFSVGMNTLFALARQAAKSLGKDFDIEVVEAHHRTKKDAPSGTAKRLAEIITKARPAASGFPIHSLRAGDVVGDHEVIFAGPGERLELTHRASSRETFARGALQAACWVIGRPSGLYGMEDVLGL